MTDDQVDGMVWVHGVFHLRAATSTSLLLRERSTHAVHELPTQHTAEPVRSPGSDGSATARERVHAEARFDPREVALGTGRRTWDLCAAPAAQTPARALAAPARLPAAPAVVGGVAYVARRSPAGFLTLESDAPVHHVVEYGRLRTTAAQVDSERGGDGRTRVRILVPLDGVRVFPTDTHDTFVRGTVDLVGAGARGDPDDATVPGEFELATAGDGLTLHASAAARPGLWQVVLVSHGIRSAIPLVVRIRSHGTTHVLASTSDADTPDRPRVSVVVPVYNAASTIEVALRSVFAQTLPMREIEIVAVDDGSSDDSSAILHRVASQHPQMRVATQPRSGTAAAPRNAGIEMATGRHLFFLDSDDVLAPTALEKMVEAADALDADVVLGRMEAFGGRPGVPRRAFKRSSTRADMVENHLMQALGPTKLFRAEHVRRLGLRFPAGLLHGEDQAFVSEAELAARRVVVLTDAVYYWVRGHEGRVRPQQEATVHVRVRKARLLADVVERYTEPGERRDALLPRAFGERALEGAFRRSFTRLDRRSQAEVVAAVADDLGHLWSPGLRARIDQRPRLLLDLVFARDAAAVRGLVRHARGNVRRLVAVPTDDGFLLDAPASVEDALGHDALRTGPPPITYLLTHLTASAGRVTALGRLHLDEPAAQPTAARAEWRPRENGNEPSRSRPIAARCVLRGTVPAASDQHASEPEAVTFSVETDTATLPTSGTWDLWLTPVWQDRPGRPIWFGAETDRSTGTGPVVVPGTGAVLDGAGGHGLSIRHRSGPG